MTPALVIYAGLINWIVTTIFVESKLFEPWRTWVIHEAYQIRYGDEWHHIGNKHWFEFPIETTQEQADAVQPVLRGPWAKVAQLVTCQLCTRVWVGFALALYLSGPIHGVFAIPANGLLYAAVGHFLFELRSRVALVTTPTTE